MMLMEGLSLLIELVVQLLEDFVAVRGLLIVYDDGEFDLLRKGVAGLFYPALIDLLLL